MVEGGVEEVRAEGAGLAQLRFQRIAPPQQFLHPRHYPPLFGQRGKGKRQTINFLGVDVFNTRSCPDWNFDLIPNFATAKRKRNISGKSNILFQPNSYEVACEGAANGFFCDDRSSANKRFAAIGAIKISV